MTVWHFVAYALGHGLGMLTMWLHVAKRWREARERMERVEAYARHVIAPTHHPATVAGILEQIEANRPVGISREAWFAEWYREMAAKMKRDELT
jgi:hypothetical protein